MSVSKHAALEAKQITSLETERTSQSVYETKYYNHDGSWKYSYIMANSDFT